jgi:hypothetical protein
VVARSPGARAARASVSLDLFVKGEVFLDLVSLDPFVQGIDLPVAVIIEIVLAICGVSKSAFLEFVAAAFAICAISYELLVIFLLLEIYRWHQKFQQDGMHQKFRKIPSFSPRKQSRITVACMALHNFIRESDMNDEHFVTYVEDSSDEDPTNDDASLAEDDTDMCAFRDALVAALVG